MSTLYKLAETAAIDYSKSGADGAEKALDPSTIFVFVEIFTQLFEAFKNCKKTPEQALSDAKNPGPFQRVLVRSKVRNELGGRRAFRELEGEQIVQSILDTGAKATLKDVKAAYLEVA